MPSRFSIIQYVPEPISGERVNIGVVAIDDGHVHCRFVRNWSRVRSFGGEDIKFLRDFAERVEEQAAGVLRLPGHEGMDLSARLEELSREWGHSIQLTPPRASLDTGERVVETLAERVLRGPANRVRQHRDHRHAAKIVTQVIEHAWEQEVGDVSKLLRRKPELPGKLTSHPFDVAIWNGQPILAAQGMSFETDDPKRLELELNARAWAVADVRKAHSKLKVAVIALPPLKKTAPGRHVFDEAKRVLEGLGAEVVLESDAAEWAKSSAHTLKRRVQH